MVRRVGGETRVMTSSPGADRARATVSAASPSSAASPTTSLSSMSPSSIKGYRHSVAVTTVGPPSLTTTNTPPGLPRRSVGVGRFSTTAGSSSSSRRTTTTTTDGGDKLFSMSGGVTVPITAKPSEIRAAARAEKERKEWIRKREADAQRRMQKIKDEIDAIKEQEAAVAAAAASGGGVSNGTDSRPKLDGPNRFNTSELEAEFKELKIEEEFAVLAASGSDDETDVDITKKESPKDLGKQMMEEMNTSFQRISLSQEDIDMLASGAYLPPPPPPPPPADCGEGSDTEFDDDGGDDQFPLDEGPAPVPTYSAAGRRREQRAGYRSPVPRGVTTTSPALRAEMRKRLNRRSKRSKPLRQPSNRVPEMRRRVVQRDMLFFDEDQAKMTESFVSTQSSVASLDGDLPGFALEFEDDEVPAKETKTEPGDVPPPTTTTTMTTASDNEKLVNNEIISTPQPDTATSESKHVTDTGETSAKPNNNKTRRTPTSGRRKQRIIEREDFAFDPQASLADLPSLKIKEIVEPDIEPEPEPEPAPLRDLEVPEITTSIEEESESKIKREDDIHHGTSTLTKGASEPTKEKDEDAEEFVLVFEEEDDGGHPPVQQNKEETISAHDMKETDTVNNIKPHENAPIKVAKENEDSNKDSYYEVALNDATTTENDDSINIVKDPGPVTNKKTLSAEELALGYEYDYDHHQGTTTQTNSATTNHEMGEYEISKSNRSDGSLLSADSVTSTTEGGRGPRKLRRSSIGAMTKQERRETRERATAKAERRQRTNRAAAATTANEMQPQRRQRRTSVQVRLEEREAKRLEEERKRMKEKREKLAEAKRLFQTGHDLCWKSDEPLAALEPYRKALEIRESLLGKYHEETGRSYFWIGKSLVKLEDLPEALFAYSRSLRIFERVLMRSNKYNKWAAHGIEVVFRKMDDQTHDDYLNFKACLEQSIAHERAGDAHKKKGNRPSAIAEYREAIDYMDEHHPDAADLHCKIAIILRQQGDYDMALEEYAFASEIYELSLGAEHPETVNTMNKLAEKTHSNKMAMALKEKLNLKE